MELIKIETSSEGIKTVNARDLHSFLEIGKDFSTWVKGRIEQYDFEENIDYMVLKSIPQNGGTAIDYHLTLDMAKELSMVERNDKGRQARKYFIECEKKLIKEPPKELTRLELIDMLRDTELKKLAVLEVNRRLNIKIEKDQPKIKFAESIRYSEGTVTIEEFAKILCKKGYQTGRNRLYRDMRDARLLLQNNLPYQQYLTYKWFEVDEYSFQDKNEKDRISKRTLITGKGQTRVWDRIKNNYQEIESK